jgi:hypothetical protein
VQDQEPVRDAKTVSRLSRIAACEAASPLADDQERERDACEKTPA